ncbi:nitrogen fixation protein [Alkalibacillus filiformis]|uniref:Nitrogen fixation protein n=1 Tax=Alkalibacillus filiformis TaxID=200990 RepID=A0ABU0DW97_9BACI|nr:M14 family metallocarboxypeptidase [Alkalibacillus filiformis]MDQ0352743.1 nitrogen fixation protein [Alkalibacillus filiformis]
MNFRVKSSIGAFVGSLALFSFLLLFVGSTVYAGTQTEKGIVINGDTAVYEEKTKESSALKTYSEGSTLIFTESDDEEWYDAEVIVDGERKAGFIHTDDVDLINEERTNLSGYSIDNTSVYKSPTKQSGTWKSYSEGRLLYYTSLSANWYEASVIVDGERQTGYIHVNDVEEPVDEQENSSGYALNEETHVYASPTLNAGVLKTYDRGHLLYYETYLSDWYRAVVYINGEQHVGYINKGHVEEPTEDSTNLSGVALTDRTNVYNSPNNQSGVLKSYAVGSVLKYESYLEDWYRAEVILDGERKSGYLSKSDVQEPVDNPVDLSGIALKDRTNVYSSPNVSSNVLKDYSPGATLLYESFIDGWYKATVFLNGEGHTGYINHSDVEEPVDNPESLSGVALKVRTHVYDSPNKSSDTLKAYNQGHILKYETFIHDWYKATVFLNGEAHTGYIHKDDVEEPVEEQESLQGYAYSPNTKVYGTPSKNSGTLKSYSEGRLLQYRTYIQDWYEATVILGGNAQTGYIHKDDVIAVDASQENLDGIAIYDKTYVYSDPSKNSRQLKGYNFGSDLIFKSFTENWYEAEVVVEGQRHTGYIYKDDVSLDGVNAEPIVNAKTTYTYDQMVKDIHQLARQYPGLIEVEVIGQSVEGRDIHAVKVGNGDTKITINSSHHAREWISTNLVMHQIDTYSQAYVKEETVDGYDAREILEQASIYYVPMVNPDGVVLVQEGPKAVENTDYVIALNGGSTNFDGWKANIRGVDLNRQYPADWDTIRYVEPTPGPERYKGPRPLSEPETQAMFDFTISHDFQTAVAYHSSGEILYWDYYTSGQLQDDSLRIANMISDKTGYPLYTPFNPSGGGYKDWVLDSLGYPGYTPELSPYIGDRPVPLSNYDAIWEQNDSIGLMLAEEAYLR